MPSIKIVSADVKANGQLRLPQSVRKALCLSGKSSMVGFIIDGRDVRLAKAAVPLKTSLSNDEVAFLASLSRRGAGKRTFRTPEAALRHLWSL